MDQHICRCGRAIVQRGGGPRRVFCGQCPCSADGCEKTGTIRGLCRYHYELARRIKSGKRCSVDGCEKPVMARGLCKACYKRENPARDREYQREYHRRYQRATVQRACLQCGADATKRQDRGSFCSGACAQKWRSVRHDVGAQPLVGDWHEVDCVACGKKFMVGVWNCVTCSDECTERSNVRRRARSRALRRVRLTSAYVEDVDPIAVFEADGYRCHLCGCLTERDKKFPHARFPTIDHVIPLAAGGTHEMANVRTACFLCNIRKGTKQGVPQAPRTIPNQH